MTIIYFDVENTLELTFITGIQRVTREFSKQVLGTNKLQLNHTYIPVLYDFERQSWRRLSARETNNLLSDKPRSTNLFKRIVRKLISYTPKPRSLYIEQFAEGSFFFDIESSWHSRFPRSSLLPLLKGANVRIARLHYDIIPILFPFTSHPDTIKVFERHLVSHIENAELFICISKKSMSDIESYCNGKFAHTPKLATVQLGSNIRPNERKQKKIARPTNPYGRFLLSVGTIEPRKNHIMLLKAFDKISQQSDLNLVIVGRPGWLSKETLFAINTHEEADKRLFYKSRVSDTELEALYDLAWLNIVPSIYEGFGLPVVESLSRRCPTICSDGGSLPEVGGDNVLIFPSNKPEKLAEITLSLFNDNKKYELLVQKAQQYQPVSWQSATRQIDECFPSASQPSINV